ncbi:uncharacterized protein LOC119322716 isoform X2 [Triticum dicoccoides]|uniref:uncharacterized protein LOC119322716 isoform X2 n=1 Tax=Triticum dicoccoides TaxID=85692 RepID=UPI001891B870|nr:uncharacterized protein LOC119322716 isoform X2 [Triticum dicoccoides]
MGHERREERIRLHGHNPTANVGLGHDCTNYTVKSPRPWCRRRICVLPSCSQAPLLVCSPAFDRALSLSSLLLASDGWVILLRLPLPDSASVLEKMRKIKRDGGDLTRSLHGNKRAKSVVTTSKESCLEIREPIQISGDLDGDSNQDVLTELSDEVKSNLSKSVASLAVCSGDTVLFACSGLAIERHGYVTRFVTSAELALVFNNEKYKEKRHNVKIEVRHEGSEVYQGFLATYDVDYNYSVVKVKTFLDVNVGLIEHAVGILPDGKVVALGRGTCGELMARSVMLADDLSVCEDIKDPVSSMLNITKAWQGGPLFSFDGNFVGMNLFLIMERAFFLPWGVLLKRVYNFRTPLESKKGFPPSETMKGVSFGERPRDEISNCYQDVYRDGLNKKLFGDLDLMGYPKLPITMLDDGMILVNTFEETFGDVWGEGVWRELGKKASEISRNVVALASFNGKNMVFACTGFFIPWNGSTAILTSASLIRNDGAENKIVENLRFEVFLPNEQVRRGTLKHYSLHYNVALLGVEDSRVVRPPKIQLDCSKSRVAAIGRCFRSGTLMAASGQLVSWSGRLDCKFVVRSSCKIAKAGIGGPLVNMDGEVIGMNFYSEKIGTPFLLWNNIGNILAYFKEKSDADEVAKDSGSSFWKMNGDRRFRLNRWPVPMPCWRHPDKPCRRYPYHCDEYVTKSKDEPDIEIPPGEEFRYGYIRGKRYRYLVNFTIPQ